MVNPRKFPYGILAYGLFNPCLASDNATTDIFASSILVRYDSGALDTDSNNTLDLDDKTKTNITITSCSLVYSTELNGETFNGYVYEAKVTGLNCDDSLRKETVLVAVEKCADSLAKNDAPMGCCPFNHGTWNGRLRLSAEPSLYPVREVDC
ncbi:hypothetical protein N7517_006229 [Penicillium concentricum]|uniref:Secreted protein CSS2 C-terminal domain-containing protein n=1 Tax=Penicillium concentricum TaxID=293559 RepID=A0A9W9S930_9EURO|nr:uncharacterized protein N7517_006229 [Penicillium concentricum]KAJ5374223.1 hypothetical protein N7517_006229 [Penicillium concentricum]